MPRDRQIRPDHSVITSYVLRGSAMHGAPSETGMRIADAHILRIVGEVTLTPNIWVIISKQGGTNFA